MAGAVGLALILLAGALLVVFHGRDEILGLPPDQFAAAASTGAVALLIATSVFRQFQGRWAQGVQALLMWLFLGVAVAAGYTYRDEAREVAARVFGEIAPGQVAVTGAGEVVVVRRADGSFVLSGRANGGQPLRFLFDTGASVVVLTAESARALGLQPATERDYSVPVQTANGRTTAAPVTLDALSFGPITERRVRALVARPGALRENLLGMTFLERLPSYEVRQNRLILRGRPA